MNVKWSARNICNPSIPNVRDAEINQLKRLQEQGLHALGHLSLIPDSIRVLVAVKPTVNCFEFRLFRLKVSLY